MFRLCKVFDGVWVLINFISKVQGFVIENV